MEIIITYLNLKDFNISVAENSYKAHITEYYEKTEGINNFKPKFSKRNIIQNISKSEYEEIANILSKGEKCYYKNENYITSIHKEEVIVQKKAISYINYLLSNKIKANNSIMNQLNNFLELLKSEIQSISKFEDILTKNKIEYIKMDIQKDIDFLEESIQRLYEL